MGGLLTTGSILAAFFAGAIALFSPCCVVFLFPAYIASAVKNRRWHLLPLTLLFTLGLGAVLLPVTLGVGILSSTIARYHTPLYYVGGLLLLGLAVLSFLGRSWSMPALSRMPSIAGGDTAGMFALGVFSGVASSCCAPVLAGVMTLSALSGTLIGSVGLGLAYVFGMVFPLFVMALLWDRLRLSERRFLRAKPIRVRLGRRTIATNTMNAAVAVAFAAMGAVVLMLAVNGNTTATPGFQLAIGRWLTDVFGSVSSALSPVPEPVLGLGLLALAGLFVVLGVRGRAAGGERGIHDDDEVEVQAATKDEATRDAPACHDPEPAGAGASKRAEASPDA